MPNSTYLFDFSKPRELPANLVAALPELVHERFLAARPETWEPEQLEHFFERACRYVRASRRGIATAKQLFRMADGLHNLISMYQPRLPEDPESRDAFLDWMMLDDMPVPERGKQH